MSEATAKAIDLRRPTVGEIIAVFARMTGDEQRAEYARLVEMYGQPKADPK